VNEAPQVRLRSNSRRTPYGIARRATQLLAGMRRRGAPRFERRSVPREPSCCSMKPRFMRFATVLSALTFISCVRPNGNAVNGWVSYISRPDVFMAQPSRQVALKVWGSRGEPEAVQLCAELRAGLESAHFFGRVANGCDGGRPADYDLDVQITEIHRVSKDGRLWYPDDDPTLDTHVVLREVESGRVLMKAVVAARATKAGISGQTTEDLLKFSAYYTVRSIEGHEGS
jgi:hypothetical protein